MTFKVPFCVQQYVDIDELIQKINEDYKFINFCHKYFTIEEYALVNFILNEGLRDILGQNPADDPIIIDDPYARPSENTPNLNPEIPSDEDPFAMPEGWNPSAGIFYDKETGNLINEDGMAVDKDGNVIGPNVPARDPLQNEWEKYFHAKYPEATHVPPIPSNSLDPEWEDWKNWLAAVDEEQKRQEEEEKRKQEEEEQKRKEEEEKELANEPKLEDATWEDWVDYYQKTHPEETTIPGMPISTDHPEWEGFKTYLKNKKENQEEDDDNSFFLGHPPDIDWYEWWEEKDPENEAPEFPWTDEAKLESPYWDDFMDYLREKYKDKNDEIAFA